LDTATDTSVVTVNNIAPAANANGPYLCNEGDTITLSGSAADPGLDTLSYAWDLDNDASYDDSTSQNPSYTCGVEGTYTIALQVTDDDNGIATDTSTITVNAIPPDTTLPAVAINSPVSGIYTTTNILVSITATDNVAVDKIWFNYGAGNISYSTPATITFADQVIYTLTAYANDTSGNVGSDSVTFTVNTSYVPPPAPSPVPRVPKPQNKIRIGAINIPADFVKAGDDLVINLDFENSGDLDLDDVSATVVIPELGIRKKVGPFDVDKSSDASRAIMLPIPEDAEPGEYTARITISNDKLKRVRHRQVIIK